MRRNQVLFSVAIVVAVIARRIRLGGLVLSRPELSADWRSLGPSPDGERAYPPQGATIADGELLLTNHWNGTRSELYRVDPDSGTVRERATMPSAAKHTSGLTWDGEWLWAVDHACNTLYRLDLDATFAAGEAVVREQFETGLRGSSGLTLLEVDGESYFVVSDFVWTIETTPTLPVGSARSYIVPRSALGERESLEESAVLSYPNSGYSQGLTWDGTYLYESLNNLGTDRVEVLDIEDAIREGDRTAITRLGSFEGPAGRIEDLATRDGKLWTTDEGTYELYRLESLSDVVDRLVDR